VRYLTELPGCGGLYVGSVYQEFWALSVSERKTVLEIVIEATEGRVPVVASASSTSLTEAVELAHHAQSLNVAVLMLWPPLFGPRSESGVIDFYERVAGETSLPVCAYSTTLSELGFYLRPAALEELAARIDNLVAVKEASFNISTHLSLLSSLGDRLEISSPFEEYWLAAQAFIPSCAPDYLMGSSRALYMQTHEAPILASFLDAARQGCYADAYRVLTRLRPLIEGVQMGAFERGAHPIAAVKYATGLLGLSGGPARTPTATMSDDERRSVRHALQAVGLIPVDALDGTSPHPLEPVTDAPTK
jgi:4-hydroxy-tetrahydrodipicolinate synthase